MALVTILMIVGAMRTDMQFDDFSMVVLGGQVQATHPDPGNSGVSQRLSSAQALCIIMFSIEDERNRGELMRGAENASQP